MNPQITIIDAASNTSVTREMTDAEYALLLEEQNTGTPPIEVVPNE